MTRWLLVLTALAAAMAPAAAQQLARQQFTLAPPSNGVTLNLAGDQALAVTYYGGQSWLGVGLADLTPASAATLKAADVNGAEVVEVYPDSPAAKAGIQAQDVITRFNGERVTSVRELDRLVNETPASRTVPVTVMRQGKAEELQVQLAARSERARAFLRASTPRPPEPPPAVRIAPPPPMPPMPARAPEPLRFRFYSIEGSNGLGLTLQSLTPQLADYFGLKSGQNGLLVASVDANGAAAKAGIAAGDILTRLGDTEIGSSADVRRATSAAAGGKVSATVLRRGKEMHFDIPVPAPVQDWR